MTISDLQAALQNPELDETTLRDFAAGCAERVYPRISHLDPQGMLSGAIGSFRSRDSDKLEEARRLANKFVRKLVQQNPTKSLLLVAKAVRGCTERTGMDAALKTSRCAAEAAEDPEEETLWQINYLHTLTA